MTAPLPKAKKKPNIHPPQWGYAGCAFHNKDHPDKPKRQWIKRDDPKTIPLYEDYQWQTKSQQTG